MNDYLTRCVDEFTEPVLPAGMTAAEAVTELEQIRQQHRDRAADAAITSQPDVFARAVARRNYASALIRRFRADVQRGGMPLEKWAVMNRAERRAAGRGGR
jgi:hypothetical protein